MAIVNNPTDSTSTYLPSSGERLRWARQTLRGMSHRDLAKLSDLPEARLRRLEHPRSLIGDIQLAEMVPLAISLDVFIPWLVDGIGHPTHSGFNQDIEWIRACESIWQAPPSAPQIQRVGLAGAGDHFDLKTTQMMSEALSPLVRCGSGVMARPSTWVVPDNWVMFGVDGPGMIGQMNVRYLRYTQEQDGMTSIFSEQDLDDPEIRLDLLPLNPLHFAYRLPRSYLTYCGEVLGQWEPSSQTQEGALSFPELKDYAEAE